jgi:hypothetical protein
MPCARPRGPARRRRVPGCARSQPPRSWPRTEPSGGLDASSATWTSRATTRGTTCSYCHDWPTRSAARAAAVGDTDPLGLLSDWLHRAQLVNSGGTCRATSRAGASTAPRRARASDARLAYALTRTRRLLEEAPRRRPTVRRVRPCMAACGARGRRDRAGSRRGVGERRSARARARRATARPREPRAAARRDDVGASFRPCRRAPGRRWPRPRLCRALDDAVTTRRTRRWRPGLAGARETARLEAGAAGGRSRRTARRGVAGAADATARGFVRGPERSSTGWPRRPGRNDLDRRSRPLRLPGGGGPARRRSPCSGGPTRAFALALGEAPRANILC